MKLSDSAQAAIATLREELGADVIVVANAHEFVMELGRGLAIFRQGGRRERDGSIAQQVALAKLGGDVLTAIGISDAVQNELFEPLRKQHSAVVSLSGGVRRPHFLQPLRAKGRPPTAEFPEIMWRADLAAACQLWFKAARGTGKDRNVLAGEVAAKFGKTMQGKSVKEYRRKAVSGDDARMAARYRDMLRLAAAHYPGEPARAAEALILSAKQQKKRPATHKNASVS